MRHNFTTIPLTKYPELISLINSQSCYNLFSEERTHLQTSRLSFFRNHKLVSAQTFSTIPPVTMNYLWNEKRKEIIKLDGNRDAVFNNLDKLELILNEETVVPYIKFVLDSVWSDKGNIRLVEDINEIDFVEKPLLEELHFMEKTIRPAIVTTTNKGYLIDTIIIYGTEIYQSIIDVQKEGLFEFQSETELKAGVSCVRVIILE
jgi:hypothetical protein